ncbi:MAG TPA: proline racemase family protein [Vicinamibacteria bacterium]
MRRVRVVDSHTGGEPTRVILDGAPELGPGTLAEQRERLRQEHGRFLSAMVGEPRGLECMIGALLRPPEHQGSVAGVIYFDTGGLLGMCGHGTIGLVATLAHLGRMGQGAHHLDTPVGTVRVELHEDGRVTVGNVPSHRFARAVAVDVPGHGRIVGDVAWGGNWFFLVRDHGLTISAAHVEPLTAFCARVRRALADAGITAEGGAEIDHVELFAPSPRADADSRNFVLCPGGAYDRSPCGTGTSAKLACLHADGELAPGALWRQESVIGSLFEARYALDPARPGYVLPSITGRAFITAEATLVIDEADEFAWGIAPAE